MSAQWVKDLRIPVVAAPMFLVSGPDLVIAASRAGAVGSFPTPNCRTLDDLETWLGTITDALDDQPWALNLVTHRTNARLADELKLVEQFRPPVVITALGSPIPALETVQGYGGQVVADVVNLGLARKAIAAGVDGLACVSAGAGGHTGFLSPFAFISAVRAEFDGLIAVGGGISDGRAVAGAIVAGADLVYMGTRFLATAESMAVNEYKQMVVDYQIDDLVVSDGITGTPASWLRPSLEANGFDPDNIQHTTERSYDATQSPINKWKDIWAAGQGLGAVKAIEPVSAVVDALVTEYDAAIADLGR